jgi:hypothetical protein
MRTQRGCKKIRLVFHRSFRRPVKIRVETEPPRSVDRVAPYPPVGTLFLLAQRQVPPPRPQRLVIQLELPSPDWRIVGDHDLKLAGEREESEA